MNLRDTKKEMQAFKDFFGGDLIGFDQIEAAKSKKELRKILDEHYVHLEMQLSDAQKNLDHFIDKLGLRLINF